MPGHIFRYTPLALAALTLLVTASAQAQSAQFIPQPQHSVTHVTLDGGRAMMMAFTIQADAAVDTWDIQGIGGDILFGSTFNISQWECIVVEDMNDNWLYDSAIDRQLDVEVFDISHGPTPTWQAGITTGNLRLNGGQAAHLMVLFMFNMYGGYPETYQLTCTEEQFQSTDGDVALIGMPFSGNVVNVYDFYPRHVDVTAMHAPEDREVAVDSVQTVAWMRLEADLEMSEPFDDPPALQSVTVSTSGSGDESTDIHLAHLILDNNTNGVWDQGDIELDARSFFSDDGTIFFDSMFGLYGDRVQMEWGIPIDILVVYDFSVQIDIGLDFSATVLQMSGEPGMGTAGLPMSTPLLTIYDPTPTDLLLDVVSADDASVDAGTTGVVLGHIRFSGNGYTVNVDTVSVTPLGEGVSEIIDAVHLIHDVNRDGNVTGLGEDGGDVLSDTSLAPTGTVALATDVAVASGTTSDLLLVVDVNASAPVGLTAGLRLSSVSSSGTHTFTLPLDLAAVTVDGEAQNDDDNEFEPPVVPDGITSGSTSFGCTTGHPSALPWWTTLLGLGALGAWRRRP